MRRMTGPRKINLVLPLALLALGVNTPPALAQADMPQATSLRIYTPFQPAGGLVIGVAVTGRASGACFANSVASPSRPDAYRCNAGNAILDPCFASLNDTAPLACSRDPWSANAVLLTRSGALPSNAKLSAADPDYAKALPWALELANGQRCTVFTGATAPVAGLRINYGCPDGGVIAGGIDRTLPLWRVFYQTANRSLSLTQVGVKSPGTERSAAMTRLPTTSVLGLALLIGACAPAATPGSATFAPAPVQPVPARSVPKTIRLGQEADGSIVDLRVGDTLELSLPGNPSTGYSWSLNLPLGPVLEQLGAPGFRPSGTGLGAGGEVILRYRAAQPGQFPLLLTYGRPFAVLPPNPQTFELFVFVR